MARFLPLYLSLVLVCVVHAVPFNDSLVGKKFVTDDPCFIRFASDRFMTGTFVTADRKTITYWPPSCPSCNADAPFQFCYERIVLHFTRRTSHPHVTRFLRSTLSQARVAAGATCEKDQPKIVAWPWGSTRANFTSAVQTIAKGALDISRFTCPQNPGRYSANKEAEGFVHYLVALAYDYYFTAL